MARVWYSRWISVNTRTTTPSGLCSGRDCGAFTPCGARLMTTMYGSGAWALCNRRRCVSSHRNEENDMASKDEVSATDLQDVSDKGEMAVGLQSVSDEAPGAPEGAPGAPAEASVVAPAVQVAQAPPPNVEKSCSRGLAA